MLVIYNPNKNPYFNLALEEYILKKTDKDTFMLWINSPAIIVGKNQNTLSQINLEYVREHDIPVVRRLSGGGAVFHDPGNINFTFIMDNNQNSFNNFKKFTYPIIEVLSKLSIDAQLSGRNDLTIGGKKFSGNAQYIYRNKILHHGTLLFSSNVNHLTNALKVDPNKFKDKGIKSVASRITNIREHLNTPLTIDEFKDLVMNHILENYNGEMYKLNDTDIQNVQRMVDEKYSTWEWNFGYSPKYNFEKSNRYTGGSIEVHLDVKNGIIKDARIYGDFFGQRDIKEIEAALNGIRHTPDDVKAALSKFNINDYFANITEEEFIKNFF